MAKNSLGKILWDMAKRGDAFLLNTKKATQVLVPYGKYAGAWTYAKSTRTCRWAFTFPAELADSKAKAYGPSGKSKTFPLPDTIYSWMGGGHPGKIHAANRSQLAWAVTKWAAFNASRLRPISELLALVDSSIAFSSWQAKVGLRWALAFSMPDALRAMAADRADFIRKLDFIGKSATFMRHLSPSRRQRFVARCLRGGPEFAVRKVFRRADADLISSVFEGNAWKCEPGLAHVFLASAEKNQTLNKFDSLLHMAQSGSSRKISRLKIHFVDEANHGGPNT